MFMTALLMGVAVLVVLMIVNMVMSRLVSAENYTIYVPTLIVFVLGLILVSISAGTNIEVYNLGLGGWGAACLFASAISTIVTSLVDINTNNA